MIWNDILRSFFQTLGMTSISIIVAYLIGLPIGIILNITSANGIKPNKTVNLILGIFVNIMRSIPCLLLIIILKPVTRFILGAWSGRWYTMIVPLVVASFGLIARSVEQSLAEIPSGEIEAAKSMGASVKDIIFHVFLVETRPSLLLGFAIASVSILGYTSFAGYIGAGGLIDQGFTFGYYGTEKLAMWICIIVVIILVQVIQEIGLIMSKKLDKRIKNKK